MPRSRPEMRLESKLRKGRGALPGDRKARHCLASQLHAWAPGCECVGACGEPSPQTCPPPRAGCHCWGPRAEGHSCLGSGPAMLGWGMGPRPTSTVLPWVPGISMGSRAKAQVNADSVYRHHHTGSAEVPSQVGHEGLPGREDKSEEGSWAEALLWVGGVCQIQVWEPSAPVPEPREFPK